MKTMNRSETFFKKIFKSFLKKCSKKEDAILLVNGFETDSQTNK